ncbi:HAD family hydrolase [Lachnospiraceae bacterium OttesenSCG-928-D06]|nr:HAD family hydrolase [Lachnospiraceae bacterium OttesenSCG-928-D06]
MKVLYVTDLDGTLLNSKNFINPYSIKVINALVEQGMHFTYATARSLVSASVVTKGLMTQMPIIAYNGAFLFDPSTREILASEFFKKEETDKVAETLKRYNISPLVYSFIQNQERVSWVRAEENEGIRRYLHLRKGDERFRGLDAETDLFEGDIFYYTCIGEREQLQPIYEIFSDDERYTCTLQQELYRTEYWCEIMPKKATKANGIDKLKKLWNFDKVVCFGDAINDIPMFQISDEAYAVGNAVDRLKEMATAVIDTNDEDGVAKWLLQQKLNTRCILL